MVLHFKDPVCFILRLTREKTLGLKHFPPFLPFDKAIPVRTC